MRTLYAKLAAALLALFVLMTAIFVTVMLISTRLYQQEISQKLNRELAEHIAKETALIDDGKIDADVLDTLFNNLMVINPSIEVYLLDPEGSILSYSAPPGRVVRTDVSLDPVRRFLSGDTMLPILGDDPRNPNGSKVFSAAPIRDPGGELTGYLYIVLASEQYDSIAQMIQGSYILRLSAGAVVASLLFAFVAGLLSFALLTRRLRSLICDVELFKQSDFSQPIATERSGEPSDEIDRLAITVCEMSARITEQVQALKDKDQLRRELVANVSHDLRTPLAALQGYIETLLIKEDLPPDDKRQCLATAARHAERLKRLITELFELSRLEANETKPHFEACQMAELVQDVVQKFQISAQAKGIVLETDFPKDLPPAEVDIALMERVLENLIDNAIRYTPKGGEVTVKLEPKGGKLEVQVSDTGIGISEDELAHVFDRYYRAGRGDPDRPEGTGLGLAIAQKIVELHGGTLDIASQLRQGTTFRFQSPVMRSGS